MLSTVSNMRLLVITALCFCIAITAVVFGTVTSAGSGHLPGNEVPATLQFSSIEPVSDVLGLKENAEPFASPLVLDPGDLVVLTYNSDGTDDFALIALAAIPGGSRFFITDCAWGTSLNDLVPEGSGNHARQLQFDVAAAGIPFGTVIRITQAGGVPTVDAALGTLTPVARHAPDQGNTVLTVGTTGDQILVYKTAGNTIGGAVTMISGFNGSNNASNLPITNGWQVGILPLPGQDGATSESNAPAGLTVYTGANASTATALGLASFPVTGGLTGQDNYRYNGPCGLADKTAWLAAINTPTNWVADDVNPFDVSLVCPGGVPVPEINVLGNGNNITDGSVTPQVADGTIFGSTAVTGGSLTRTFTIQNLGAANLTIPAGGITFTNAAEFSVSGITLPATIPASGSTTFVVTFDPTAAGLRTSTVNIANNDSNENPYDFAIQGNAYVVVSPTGTAPQVQWSSTVQNTNAGATRAVGSTNSGDIVAGTRINSGAATDLRIMRYAGGTGVVSWTRDITNGTNDEIADMVVDPANGDAYICANATAGANSTDWFVMKVNGADGTVAWTRSHNGTLGTGSDSCFDIARTSDGNVVAAGLTFSSPTGLNYGRVEKIDASTGASLWAYTNPTDNSQFSGIATDTTGNTYAVGIIIGLNSNGLTVKLNSSGGASWTTVFDGTANLNDSFSHVVVDPSGNPVVGGTTRISDAPVTNSDGIVIKYAAATGAETWRRLITGSALASESINNLVIDTTGDLYLAGSIRNLSTSDRDAYVSKITGTTGVSAWITTKFGSGANSDDRFQNVRVVGSDVYAVGNLDNSNRDVITSRFNAASGAETWSAIFNGTGNGADDVYFCKHVIAVLGTDSIAVGGQTVDVSTNTYGIVLKYSAPTDLTATMTDTVSGTTPFGSTWDWRTDIANPGAGQATFGTGQVILRDNLPNTNVTYGTPAISNQVGLSGAGTVSCSIASFNLTCTANGGPVNIAAAGGFRVTVTATPTATGTFSNPRAAGVCAVDPDLIILESNESNNACSGSVTVTKANTTIISFLTSGNPTVVGQSVTFTATVAATAPGAGNPTGTVSFRDNGVNIGTCAAQTVVANVATCSISSLAFGSHPITAVYNGDANFNASPASGSIPQVVNKANTTTGLVSSLNPAPANNNVTFTATINVTSPGAGTPSGTVQFLDGASPITGCTAVAVSVGQAQCTTSALTVGNHTITSAYSGDGSFNTSNGTLTGNPQVIIAAIKSRADFDGDGRTDVSVYRPSDGNWYLNRSTAGLDIIRWGGAAGDILVPGDYDGDGKADTAVFRVDANNANPDYFVLNSNGFVFTGVSWGVVGDVPVSGDYDGDGKVDFAIFRPSTGTWYILNSGNGSNTVAPFGLPGDVPLAMDNNNDGKTNLAVFRPSSNTWYIAKPTGVPAQNFDAIPFGLSGDSLVPADYDGDNKDDIAVFRPTSGVWYILRSSDSGVTITPFGSNGDVAVPGDYDGDGKDDVAIYRNGTWWLNRSTAGVTTVAFGLGTDTAIPSAYHP